jgi:hypothetical protein
VEGSSIILEVNSSYKTDSIASKRQNNVVTNHTTPEPNPEQNSKSSESRTATFASKPAVKHEESKTGNLDIQSKNSKEGPFEYGVCSGDEDYDSEQEGYDVPRKHKNRSKTPTKGSNTHQKTSKMLKSPQKSPESSIMSEDSSDWITNPSHNAPKSVAPHQKSSPSSSQHIDSMSTHTSPQFQSHPKLLRKQKLKKQKKNFITHQQFKQFVSNVKANVVSEKPKKQLRRAKSPLSIVDKLVDDAHRRLKVKQMNEPIGRDTPFADVYGKWNGTLRRDRSAQPKTPIRKNSDSTFRSDDSAALR